MFLNFLIENSEQILFLKFSYILAVVEKEDDHYDIVPICAANKNHEKVEYLFE